MEKNCTQNTDTQKDLLSSFKRDGELLAQIRWLLPTLGRHLFILQFNKNDIIMSFKYNLFKQNTQLYIYSSLRAVQTHFHSQAAGVPNTRQYKPDRLDLRGSRSSRKDWSTNSYQLGPCQQLGHDRCSCWTPCLIFLDSQTPRSSDAAGVAGRTIRSRSDPGPSQRTSKWNTSARRILVVGRIVRLLS